METGIIVLLMTLTFGFGFYLGRQDGLHEAENYEIDNHER